MSVPKKGKVFPKKGKVLHSRSEGERYAVVIAAALRQDVGGTPSGDQNGRPADRCERTDRQILAPRHERSKGRTSCRLGPSLGRGPRSLLALGRQGAGGWQSGRWSTRATCCFRSLRYSNRLWSRGLRRRACQPAGSLLRAMNSLITPR